MGKFSVEVTSIVTTTYRRVVINAPNADHAILRAESMAANGEMIVQWTSRELRCESYPDEQEQSV